MKTALLGAGLAGVLLAVLLAVDWTQEQTAVEGAEQTVVGFDVDTTGNGADTLGPTDFCRSVLPGEVFSVDVFVDEILAGQDFAGFNYAIGFDDSRVQLLSQNHLFLLALEPGSSVSDWSDPVPDAVSPHVAGAVDFGIDEIGPVSGVLGRYTLEVLPTALTGTFSLTLTDVSLSDGMGDPIPVDQVLDGTAVPPHGIIAVGESCPTEGADLAITKTDSQDPVQGTCPTAAIIALNLSHPW